MLSYLPTECEIVDLIFYIYIDIYYAKYFINK